MFRELFCYDAGLYGVRDEAEGYIVAKFTFPFESHPFLWIVLFAAVPILAFLVLKLIFKAKSDSCRKGILNFLCIVKIILTMYVSLNLQLMPVY